MEQLVGLLGAFIAGAVVAYIMARLVSGGAASDAAPTTPVRSAVAAPSAAGDTQALIRANTADADSLRRRLAMAEAALREQRRAAK